MGWDIYNQTPKRHFSIADQFIRSADSIGANIAEGYGRGSDREKRQFAYIARGSLYETRYWSERIQSRSLARNETLEEFFFLLQQEVKLINGYISHLNRKIKS